jgi:hypothetical protein
LPVSAAIAGVVGIAGLVGFAVAAVLNERDTDGDEVE